MQVGTPDNKNKKLWFPTPENLRNQSEDTPIQQDIPKELRETAERESLEPKRNTERRTNFLPMFKWNDSLIPGELIVEFNCIFVVPTNLKDNLTGEVAMMLR